MTPEEILGQAADLIEAEGWCQGLGIDDMGHRCLGRALWDATRLPICVTGITSEAWYVAKIALDREIFPYDIIGYNDTRGRTKDEVVTALRNAKRWL